MSSFCTQAEQSSSLEARILLLQPIETIFEDLDTHLRMFILQSELLYMLLLLLHKSTKSE